VAVSRRQDIATVQLQPSLRLAIVQADVRTSAQLGEEWINGKVMPGRSVAPCSLLNGGPRDRLDLLWSLPGLTTLRIVSRAVDAKRF